MFEVNGTQYKVIANDKTKSTMFYVIRIKAHEQGFKETDKKSRTKIH